MKSRVKQTQTTRAYHAPRRTAAAAETRRAILSAAKEQFEARGWAATTMRSIAMSAGVSPKTVEALFATKPALMEAAVMAALGDDTANIDTGHRAVLRPEVMLELRAEALREIEEAPDAATMLELQSELASEVNARAARLCWALETAVPSDERLAEISARMSEVLLFGVRWLADGLLQKPGVRPDLTLREAEDTFLIGIHWNTYRTLTTTGAMRPEDVQTWVTRYLCRMLLA
jgi:AcrR family transcriptional regulator